MVRTLSIFEQHESGEGGVVIEQCRVFAELDPDVVVGLEAEHERLTARPVPRPPIAVQGTLVLVVHHDPSIHILCIDITSCLIKSMRFKKPKRINGKSASRNQSR